MPKEIIINHNLNSHNPTSLIDVRPVVDTLRNHTIEYNGNSITIRRTNYQEGTSILNFLIRQEIALPIIMLLGDALNSQISATDLLLLIKELIQALANHPETYIFAAFMGMAITNSIFHKINTAVNLLTEQRATP